MKLKKTICFAFLCSVFLLSGCDLGLDTGNDNETTFSNIAGGHISYKDYAIRLIPGSLFSDEEDYSADTLGAIELGVTAPKPIPDGYNLVGKIVRFTPENYAFNFPASIYFPAKGIEDPLDAVILRYNEEAGEWSHIPITLMNDDPTQLGASVITLGTFALVEKNNGVSSVGMKSVESTQAFDSEGGVRYADPMDNSYWYCITVKNVAYLKFPDQWIWYSDSEYLKDYGDFTWSGLSAMSGTTSIGISPINPVHMHLPQGSYEFWISKVKYEGVNKGVWLTYSKPAKEIVDRPLEYTGSWSGDQDISFKGWYDLVLPTGGTWQTKRPEELPYTANGNVNNQHGIWKLTDTIYHFQEFNPPYSGWKEVASLSECNGDYKVKIPGTNDYYDMSLTATLGSITKTRHGNGWAIPYQNQTSTWSAFPSVIVPGVKTDITYETTGNDNSSSLYIFSEASTDPWDNCWGDGASVGDGPLKLSITISMPSTYDKATTKYFTVQGAIYIHITYKYEWVP